MQLGISIETAGLTLLVAVLAVVLVVALTRLNGLRTFSKMAPHDFAVTLAIGSVLAAVAAGSVPIAQGVVAWIGLYGTQRLLQWWRMGDGEDVVDNQAVLLMVGPEVRWDAMNRTGVTASDLRAKLREANVVRVEQVIAVVLEGTGDISVLHADPDDDVFDVDLLAGVAGLPDTQDEPLNWRGTGRLGP